jgi:hypothetical protein
MEKMKYALIMSVRRSTANAYLYDILRLVWVEEGVILIITFETTEIVVVHQSIWSLRLIP